MQVLDSVIIFNPIYMMDDPTFWHALPVGSFPYISMLCNIFVIDKNSNIALFSFISIAFQVKVVSLFVDDASRTQPTFT